jgi:uncharacterized membrane protein
VTIPQGWQVRLIQILAIPGMLLAYFLWLYHDGRVYTTCVTNSLFDCGQVSGPASPYASIGPVPIALIGLIGYAVIFLLIWLQDWVPLIGDNLPELLAGVVGLAALISVGLTALEVVVIGAFCQYCLWSAGIILLMFLLAVGYLRSSRRSTATLGVESLPATRHPQDFA